jgi:hypothetical protein
MPADNDLAAACGIRDDPFVVRLVAHAITCPFQAGEHGLELFRRD